MQIKEITSNSNSVLKQLRALDDRSERKSTGLFLVEGRTLIEEAIRKNIELDNIVTTEAFLTEYEEQLKAFLPAVSVVSEQLFKTLYTTNTSCGIISTAKQPKRQLDQCFSTEHPLIVIGDQIQDPGNLGTIMRSCLAFGVDAIILTRGSVDCFSPKVVRSSMGAIFALPIVQEVEMSVCLDTLSQHNVIPHALDAGGNSPYWDLNCKASTALIFGNEGNGLSNTVHEHVSNLVKIPISPNCESLNVSVSVAIVLAHAHRQRQL